jgi:chemotaxis protein MotA
LGLSTIIGLALGLSALAIATIMEGGELSGFASPSAALIVFGGTFGALLVSFPLNQVAKFPKVIMLAFTRESSSGSSSQAVDLFVGLAEKARREGLLSLEEEVEKIKDGFVRSGILMVVDGIDPDVVRSVLDIDIGAMAERHQRGYSMFESMGGFAPTMGIIGTVMGLVHVLGNLEDPSELGPAIAVAFIATLYGVASANILWLPIGSKLKAQSKSEIAWREVAREGILAVQAGDNPRIVREKLEAFLSKGQRSGKADEGASLSEQGAGAEASMAGSR